MMKSDSATLTREDDYKLTAQPAKDKEEDYGIPQYMAQIDLTKEQEDRLLSQIKKEFEAIKRERDEAGLEDKWKALENQYEGTMEEDELRQFNLSRKVTKIKCDTVERNIMKAAWKTDQKFSITARPQFEREGGREVVEAQTDYLDYKLDNDIPFMEPQRKTTHSAIVKGVGILKWNYELKREKRKRNECYDGSKKELVQIHGQIGEKNIGLEQFMKAYPDAQEKHAGIIKKLL